MKQIGAFWKNRVGYVLTINIAALLTSVFLFCPFFEENDDAFLSLIAEGAFGTRDYHLIYTNILYGRLLTLLYMVLPQIRWHTILQYLFIFLSLCMFTYLLCDSRRGRILSAFLLLTCFYELYVSLQYSKTSTAVSLIGYCLLIYCIREKELGSISKRLYIPAGVTFTLFGFILRDDGFYLATIFALIVFASDMVKAIRCMGLREDRRGLLMKYIRMLAPVLAVVLLLFSINAYVYKSDDTWNTFMAYNDIRTELIDYRFDLLDYDQYGNGLRALDISQNDALLYLTWQFGDDGVFTVEKMKEVLHAPFAQFRIPDLTMAKAFAKHIYDDILILNACFLGAVTIIGLYLAGGAKKGFQDRTEMFPFYLSMIALSGILFFFEYCQRWSHRIVYAAFIALIIEFTFELATLKLDPVFAAESDSILLLPFVLIAVSVFSLCLGNRLEKNRFYREEPDYRAFLEYVSENKETLYIADTFTFQNGFHYDVFQPYEEGSLDNFVFVGSWFINSPITKEITRKFDCENPYEALRSTEDNVILVDNLYADEKVIYLNEHYAGRYDTQYLDDRFGFSEYRIYVEND